MRSKSREGWYAAALIALVLLAACGTGWALDRVGAVPFWSRSALSSDT